MELKRWIGLRSGEAIWVGVGAAIVSAVTAVALATDEAVIPAGLFVMAALLVAARAGPRATALVVVYGLAAELLLVLVSSTEEDVSEVLRLVVVAGGGALAVWISSLRALAEQAEQQSSFIADAGARLDMSLDYETTVRTLARLPVPEFADWCTVFVRNDDGSIRQIAVAHEDPAKERLAWEIDRRYPFNVDQPAGVGRVIQTGEGELLEEVPDSLIEASARDAEHADLVRTLGLRSVMLVPLRARGRTIGAISFAIAESGRRFDSEDFDAARSFADRAALAVDNARLHTRLSEAEAGVRRAALEVQSILHGVPSAITVQDPSGRLVYANEAAVQVLGFRSVEELLETPPPRILEKFEMLDEDREPLDLSDLPGRIAMRGERPPDKVVFFRERATGAERWSLVKATPILGDAHQMRFVVTSFDDITDQKRQELAERFLSESSRLLTATLEYETLLDNVAHLAVPSFADWCAVDLIDDRGHLQHVALAHADPSKIMQGEELRRRYPQNMDEPTGVPNVVRTGMPELYAEIPEELLVESAQDEQHLALLRALGLRSVIIAPMSVGKRTIGALSFVTAESGRLFDELDLTIAVELGRRAATAVDNARLYEERTRIARTLQRSLLPPVLPDIPGVELAARFRPAGEGYEVGGDFYDVFNTGDGWGVVIGDVCGKGPEAAALTGLARHTLRAAAMQEDDPGRILETLSEAIRREHTNSQFCTAAYGRLELRSVGACLHLSSGGHPLPLLLTEHGEVREVGAPGSLLGTFANGNLASQTLELEPGSVVVFFTDGVIEAGHPRGAFGIEGLCALLESCVGLSANEIAERIDTAVVNLGEEPPDDVAVLVLRVRE